MRGDGADTNRRCLKTEHRWMPRLAASQEGSQIVELAVALPILAVLMVGIMDFAGAVNLKQKLDGAVQAGARLASSQSTADLTNTRPASVDAVRDAVDRYLAAAMVNDCGLSSAAPTGSGLTWTYTSASGCPQPLTLSIERGYTFATAGPDTVLTEATRVTMTYPYVWHFNRAAALVSPNSNYPAVLRISAETVVQNLNE